MTPENHVEVFDHDGYIVFALTRGGYCIQDGNLAISVETDRLDGGGYPNCAYFCIFDFPLTGSLKKGMSFTYKRPRNNLHDICDLYEFEDQPKGHAYFQFHVEDIEITWTITKIVETEIWFTMVATHDDINRYDARAKPTPTRGLFRLSPRPLSELWIP